MFLPVTPISIHALRKECDVIYRTFTVAVLPISIHALRKECDNSLQKFVALVMNISIHALRKECDGCCFIKTPVLIYFYPRTP